MEITLKDRMLQLLARQSWMRGRDRILRMFAHPDHQASRPFDVDFFGKRYSGNLTNFIDWWVFYYGAFAYPEVHLLQDLAAALRAHGKQVNFFDVGANIGHHTLFMSSHADPCFAFEPFHVVRSEMERKLAHAGVRNVTIFPVALGDATESKSFHPPTGANLGTGTLGDTLPDNASSETIDVSVVHGDEFFAQQNLPPVSLLKIDVEGYEVPVLRGLSQVLRRDRPAILMEIQQLTGNDGKGKQLRELLYPDHILFEVANRRNDYELRPLQPNQTTEALVLPAELKDIVHGSRIARF